MESSLKVRTNLKVGQYGWWWLPGGYIARPGRPIKQFTGWWYGPAPKFYYPLVGEGGGAMPFQAPPGAEGEGGEGGTVAPPAPQ